MSQRWFQLLVDLLLVLGIGTKAYTAATPLSRLDAQFLVPTHSLSNAKSAHLKPANPCTCRNGWRCPPRSGPL